MMMTEYVQTPLGFEDPTHHEQQIAVLGLETLASGRQGLEVGRYRVTYLHLSRDARVLVPGEVLSVDDRQNGIQLEVLRLPFQLSNLKGKRGRKGRSRAFNYDAIRSELV